MVGSLKKKVQKHQDMVDGPVVRGVIRRSLRRREPPFMEEVFGGGSGGRPSSLGDTSKVFLRGALGRKIAQSDGKSSPVPNIRMSSGSDSVPPSATLGHINFDLLHQLSLRPNTPRLSAAGSDDVATDVDMGDLEPATKALKLMVCVSRNKECLATLVSYLCLPKFMDKYVLGQFFSGQTFRTRFSFSFSLSLSHLEVSL